MKERNIITLLLLIVSVITACNGPVTDDAGSDGMVRKAAEIHKKVLTLDSHCDSPLWLLHPGFDITMRHDPYKDHSRVDFPRMKEGGLDASFFAVFLSQGNRNEEGNAAARKSAEDIFALIHTAGEVSPDACVAYEPEDAYTLEKEGKCAIFIGMENGYPIGQDISLVQHFYNLGARYITLCHTLNNDICDSSTDTLEYGGLSDFGREVVKEMNRIGMMIDVSHISDSSFYDVIEISKAPVIASHSCTRALCNHPRNLDDKMLVKLAENGGVIQICLVNEYIKELPPNPQRDSAMNALHEKYSNFEALSEEQKDSARNEWFAIQVEYPEELAGVSDLVDHIDHAVKVAGIDHVGIGTDFDGGAGIDGCFDVSEMGNITLELVRRGYTEEEIAKIWAGNFMRVFREVRRCSEIITK
ncbi:MAG: dipeptidase [Bacteroidetes bacterium]|nr:dipeptidase [Bacteroidota bacterium]